MNGDSNFISLFHVNANTVDKDDYQELNGFGAHKNEKWGNVKNNVSNSRILLVGEPNTGKTSIAFAYAYDAASLGETVLMICGKSKIEAKPPIQMSTARTHYNNTSENQVEYSYSSGDHATKAGMQPGRNGIVTVRNSEEIIEKINMKYVSGFREFKMLMAGLHAFHPKPTVVLIDDFSDILDPLGTTSRSSSAFIDLCIMMAAFIDDALLSCTDKKAVKLLLTDSCLESNFLTVMKRLAVTILQSVKPSRNTGSHKNYSSTFSTNTHTQTRNDAQDSFVSVVKREDFSHPITDSRVVITKIEFEYDGEVLVHII